MKKDLYQEVTDRIVSQLEKGVIPWERPWTGTQSGAISGSTGKPYSLLNQFLLSKPGKWYTYKQTQELGGQVRKGEKSSMVVFWKQVKVTDETQDGTESEKLVPMLRYYNVFHASQIDGLPEDPEVPAPVIVRDGRADATIQNYVAREGLGYELRKSDEAFYSSHTDRVVLPLMEQFLCAAEFYSTAFHELTHSTGHSSRLDRLVSGAAYGKSDDYSREELVAEIGAATLMAAHGLESPRTLKNSAAYIQSWLRALKNDKKMIVWAAGRAAKAVDFILSATPEGSGPQDPPEPEPEPVHPYAYFLGKFSSQYADDKIFIRHSSGTLEVSLDGFAAQLNQTTLKKILALVIQAPNAGDLISKILAWIRDRIVSDFCIIAQGPSQKEAIKLTREIARYQKFESLCLKYV